MQLTIYMPLQKVLDLEWSKMVDTIKTAGVTCAPTIYH